MNSTLKALLRIVCVLSGLALPGRGMATPGTPTTQAEYLDSAYLLLRAGRYAAAESLSRAALARFDRADAALSAALASTLGGLVEALLFQRKLTPEAVELAQRALDIRAATPGQDSVGWTISLRNMGKIKQLSGDFESATQHFDRAVRISRRFKGSDRVYLGMSLGNRASLYLEQGEYTSARPLAEEAIDMVRPLLPDEDYRYVAQLSNYGILLWRMGDFVTARRHMSVVLRIRQKNFGPNHVETIGALSNLGGLMTDMGDFSEAKRLFQQALAAGRTGLPPGHPYIGILTNNLAGVHMQAGELDSALTRSREALAAMETALPAEHPLLGAPLINIADLLADRGEFGPAEEYYRRSLGVREKGYTPDHPEVAESQSALGYLIGRRGQFDEGLSLLEAALRTQRRLLGDAHPSVATSELRLAEVAELASDTDRALRSALGANTRIVDQLRLTSRTLPENRALRYATSLNTGIDLILRLAMARQDSAAITPALDHVIRQRAGILDEIAERHRAISDSGDERLNRLSDSLQAVEGRLANATLRAPVESKESYRRLVEGCRASKDQLEQEIADLSIEFRDRIGRRRLGLAEIRHTLPARAVLVSYWDYRELAPADPAAADPASQPGLRRATADGTYAAFVLRPGSAAPTLVRLGTRAALDSLVHVWRELAGLPAAGESESAARRAERLGAVGAELRRRVWDPLEISSRECDRIFIVPEGSLNLLNFGALPGARSGYLIEETPVLDYLTTERDLVPERDRRVGADMLVMADPDFNSTRDGEVAALHTTGGAPPVPSNGPGVRLEDRPSFRSGLSNCPDFATMRFAPLPGTGREAERISGTWRATHPGGRVTRGAGGQATERFFKTQAPGKRVLHLATHGFFLGADCDSAAPGVADPGALTGRGAAQSAAGENSRVAGVHRAVAENPLLLCGLALAGANDRRPATPGEEDGVLTAEEIGAMNLSGVEWVVLSACDTGLGVVRSGEGVFGLRRAFAVAGAGALVMSLWRVEDSITARWMNGLYQARYSRGMDTARAVREASLQILRDRRARRLNTGPSFWGGFVAVGRE